MKISKLFHWLYFMVMMLPLFVVPIYFIYSQRHDLTEQTQVDIQYKYQSNVVNSSNDILINNVYKFDKFEFYVGDDHQYEYVLNIYSFETSNNFSNQFYDTIDDIDFTTADFKLTKLTLISNTSEGYINLAFDDISYISLYIDDSYSCVFTNVILSCVDGINDFKTLVNDNYDYYLPSYTDYNVINSVHVEDTNSSITNAFVNSFADTIDKYFNYDNALNLGDLYTWLNTTFFSNNAPLGFFIFWHLLIYWLLTSLLWLLFDVLLYVPQLCHRWLDKASIS